MNSRAQDPIRKNVLLDTVLRTTLLALLLALVAGSPAFAQTAEAETSEAETAELPTVDEVIDRYVEATGGYEAWEAVESIRMSGTMRFPNGIEAPFAIVFERPGKVRMDMEMQGMTITQAYDGETGWAVMPMMGQTEPTKLAGDQLQSIKDQADFEGMLIDYREKGHEVKLAGVEDVEGTEAYKLVVDKADGGTSEVFIDTEHFMQFRQDTTAMVQGVEREVSTGFGGYKSVGELVIPHSIDVTVVDAGATQSLDIQEVEVGVEVEEGFFTMPETEEAAGEAAE